MRCADDEPIAGDETPIYGVEILEKYGERIDLDERRSTSIGERRLNR